MGTGAITQYIDVAQIALYAFWIFFAGLIYYLHQEDKREGYPLESDRSGGRIKVQGFPAVPKPKTFKLRDGRVVMAPNFRVSTQPLGGTPSMTHLGSPLEPTGDPMLAAVGPGSYSDRADIADTTVDNELRVVPLRSAPDFVVSRKDPDPRGMPVIGADNQVGGTVVDLWVDRAEVLFRYLEVEVPMSGGSRRVLLPVNFSRIGSRSVKVRSILARQFGQVPGTRNPDSVTLLEEDKIMGYYGGGTLYATPNRQEPAAVIPHDQAPEHEFEAELGLPEPLPVDERILWQGSPDWRVMAREAMHLRALAIYFVVLLIWRGATIASNGGSMLEVAEAVLWLLPLAVVAIGILATLAWLVSKTSVYTITDKRVVMRIGVVLSITFNLPYSKIEAASLRTNTDGSGDLSLLLNDADRIALVHLWPHARPWQVKRTQPMLRAVNDVRSVAAVLSAALADSAGVAHGALPPMAAPERQAAAPAGRQPLAA